ncbi:MAG: pyruvate dehydrogenase [Gemmatimonadetes bacterium]|nr:MAG: pyruvate dehydrogenase [Gemmatimonadota bacterium]
MARTGTVAGGGRGARGSAAAPPAAVPADDVELTQLQRLELYYWMRLTRSLEERLVNLYRQTKVVGGLFRSLGQEADAVGSAYALERSDVLSPLIRNLGSMLVKGATPVEILKQYMAKGDSPTRGRELNIHFGDTARGFIGQISPLGDMVPVMAGVTLSFKMRRDPRVGLVYVGDGATSTGAFHEGINFAAVQRCPLVVVVENNGYAYSTPTRKQTLAAQFIDKAIGYGIAAEQADGNDVIATYAATRRAVDRARRGDGVTLVELITYRRKGHAEHDNQSYVPAGEIDRWERENDPITRYLARLRSEGVTDDALAAIDARVAREIDEATDLAEQSGVPEALDALVGVYADPPSERPLWYRAGQGGVVDQHERPEGWGTYDAAARGAD